MHLREIIAIILLDSYICKILLDQQENAFHWLDLRVEDANYC